MAFPKHFPLRTTSVLAFTAALAGGAIAGCDSTTGNDTTSDNGLGGASSGSGGTTAAGGGSGGTTIGEGDVEVPPQPVSDFIVVDQFGYLPESEKIAVVRVPQTGFDAPATYAPPTSYALMDAKTKTLVKNLEPSAWSGGATHDQSGDKAWWLDFSTITTPGVYYLLDETQSVRSDLFRIADDVYRDALKQAVRMFFYQRVGYEKKAEFAGAAWADTASHLGALQDGHARLYSAPSDASTERDLRGGWFDAGDYNKYTAWTGDYVASLLRAYEEKPSAFTDDYGLPDSGNGVADVLDEARFGLEHLARLQEPSGGVLSIVSLSSASPPSAATGPSLYGPVTTNASIRAALAYSAGARAFASIDATFASGLRTRAENAWTYAVANPDVEFQNNSGDAVGIGSGQQEVDADTRTLFMNCLAVELYRLTGDAEYKSYFEAHYDEGNYGVLGGYVAAWEAHYHDYYLDYAALPDADATVKDDFVSHFTAGMAGADNFGFLATEPDPYMAYVSNGNYTWGSSAHKSRKGSLFYEYVVYDLDSSKKADASRAAARYVHYLHGVNPLGLVYLSNMGDHGAHRSVTQFFHTWFANGTRWDEVGVSQDGPPPGYLVGGANPSYNWDSCCDGGTCPDAGCGSAPLSPPFGQPAQKSYAQFNDSWPLDSWSVTEPSDGYQVAYIRLLSKFVN